MILILSKEYDPHADLVIKELRKRNVNLFRLNAEDLFTNIAGTFRLRQPMYGTSLSLSTGDQCCLEKVSLIYQRGFSLDHLQPYDDDQLNLFFKDEASAFVQGTLLSAGIPWFNHPNDVEQAAYKLNQLARAMELGFNVPETLVSNDPIQVGDFVARHATVIQKVLNRSRLNDDGQSAMLSYTRIVRPDTINGKAERIAALPSIYQPYVEKKVEIRVTVAGNDVIAVAIGSDGGEQAIDWRKGDLSNVPHSAHCLPDEISEKSVALVRTFGLHYGAIDFILTPDNRYVFLELNPEGLWGWLEVLTEVKITERIVDEMLRLQR